MNTWVAAEEVSVAGEQLEQDLPMMVAFLRLRRQLMEMAILQQVHP